MKYDFNLDLYLVPTEPTDAEIAKEYQDAVTKQRESELAKKLNERTPAEMARLVAGVILPEVHDEHHAITSLDYVNRIPYFMTDKGPVMPEMYDYDRPRRDTDIIDQWGPPYITDSLSDRSHPKQTIKTIKDFTKIEYSKKIIPESLISEELGNRHYREKY